MEQAKMTPAQVNGIARSLIAANGVRMTQQIFGQTVVPATMPTLTVLPRNVGLIMGFWVRVKASIHNTTGGATAITPTDFGGANVVKQFVFTDLNNNTRIQTPGWHINFLNTVKSRWPFLSSLLTTAMDGNAGIAGEYGSNWTVNVQPASIADTATGVVEWWYYVPLAYSDQDYRGAVYANVVNATMQLQITLNTTPVVASAADTTNAVYKAAAGAGDMSSATVEVYQDYIDQLPMGNGGPILPILDLSTIYELKQTVFSAITAGNDFPIQYSNFRDFLSTFVVYYNGAARTAGSDINYLALQSANFTNIWKCPPSLVAAKSRQMTRTDFPLGVYYLGSRTKPISTTQYGNMEVILNPSVAGATAYALVAWEDFALVNTITQAGSLPAA